MEGFNAVELQKMIFEIRNQWHDGINSIFVVPDWKNFKETVDSSEHSLCRFDSKHGFYLDDSDYPYQGPKVTQSRFNAHYVFTPESPSVFGWKDMYCRDCGNKDLFYNTSEDIYYCPPCSLK